MITSREIKMKQFERVGRNGYRADEVDQFLEQIAREVEQYDNQNRDLVAKLQVLADKVEEYRKDEDSLSSALLSAQKLGDQIVRDAKKKSEQMLAEAESKAERIVEGTRAQVEHEKMLLGKMKAEVKKFKNRLLSQYKSHLELINALPEENAEPVEELEETPAPVDAAPQPEEPAVEEMAFAEPAETPEPEPQPEPAVTAPAAAERKTVVFEPISGSTAEPAAAPLPTPDEGFVLQEEPEREEKKPSRINFGHSFGEGRFGALEFGPGFSLGDDKKRRR